MTHRRVSLPGLPSLRRPSVAEKARPSTRSTTVLARKNSVRQCHRARRFVLAREGANQWAVAGGGRREGWRRHTSVPIAKWRSLTVRPCPTRVQPPGTMSRHRRPRRHTYDYNYKVGESSYQDMLAYLDRKQGLRSASPPPVRKSFAERFVERPIYGELGPLGLGSAAAAGRQRDALDREELFSGKTRASLADGDLEAEEFIASLKRRPRAEANGPSSLPGDSSEDLGSRTRRAMQKVDAEFEAMGLYDKPLAASSALAVRGEGEGAGAMSSAQVSSARVSSSVSSQKVAASKESSARSKRSVRYEEEV